MITREDYLKALDIVQAYHEQLNIPAVRRSFDALEKGDKIVFDRVMSKYLTVGKEYKVWMVTEEFTSDWGWYSIYDDTGKSKRLKHSAKGYIVRLVQNCA